MRLGCRGAGTNVVRMVLAGKTCSDGGKTFRCVYEELRPHSMRDWTGRQSFADHRLTPNDFGFLAEVEARLLRFQERYEALAQPFEWRFTRYDLLALLDRLEEQQRRLPLAA